jgi:hypothetical protein
MRHAAGIAPAEYLIIIRDPDARKRRSCILWALLQTGYIRRGG